MQKSKCPIEGGVVSTKWGTISSGNLIATIAAELEKTVVKSEKIIEYISRDHNTSASNLENKNDLKSVSNNVWVASLLGDLGEVIMNQASQDGMPSLAEWAQWNDTVLPRVYYQTQPNWEMSSAELLGGIDGIYFNINEIKSFLFRQYAARIRRILYSFQLRIGILDN